MSHETSRETSRAVRAFLRSPDEETFLPVYESSKQLVYTLCVRILGNEADALDAFQSVYSRLLALARSETKQSLHGDDLDRLLSRLALREAGNLRKRRARRARRERPLATADERAAAAADTERRLNLEQIKSRLDTLVDELPEKLRLPIQLHYLHGVPQREVARALDESLSTVSYRIRSGLRRLERSTTRSGLGRALPLLGAVAGGAVLFTPTLRAGAAFVRAESALASSTSAAAASVGASSPVRSALFIAAGLLVLASTAATLWWPSGDRERDAVPNDGAAMARVAPSAPPEVPDANAAPVAPTEPAPPTATSRALSLRVVWADDGTPVDGAVLRVSPREPEEARIGEAAPPGRATDTDGLVVFELTDSPGDWSIAVEHGDAVGRSVEVERRDGALRIGGDVVAPGDTATIALERDIIVEGTVRHAETDAIVPLAVVFRDSPFQEPLETQADDDGRYRIAGLQVGTLELKAAADGFATVPAKIDLRAAGVHVLDFALHPAATVHMLVVDTDGAPLEDARISPSMFGCNGCYRGDVYVTTDAAGAAVLDAVSTLRPPTLKVSKEGFATRYAENLRVAAGGFEDVRVVLERSDDIRYVITGLVTDPNGAPIPGATVEYKDGSGTSYGSGAVYGQHKATTGQDGRYLLEFEDDYRSCHLGVGAPGWSPVVRTQVSPGKDGEPVVVDFQLEPAHWLEGTVVDEDGAPVAGAEVSAMPRYDLLNEGIAYPIVYRHAKTDADGRFRLDDLAGPTCAVRVSRPRGRDFPLRELEELAVDQDVEIVLKRWGVIRGRVVDGETHEPITEFAVKIRGPIEVSRADPGESFSSADGSFVLRHLVKDERYGVIVEAAGHVEARVESIAPQDASSQDVLTVEIGRGTLIEGTVIDRTTGAPIAGARVTYGVLPEHRVDWDIFEHRHALANFQRSTTDATGAFAFLEGAAGVIFVEAQGYRRLFVTPAERGKHEVSPNTLRIALDPGVSYSAIVSFGGKPAADARVTLLRTATPHSGPTREEGEVVGNAETDTLGRFVFEGIAAGTYAIEVQTRPAAGGQAHVSWRRVIDIGPEGAHDVDLAEPRGAVTFNGTLRETDGSLPISSSLVLRPRFEATFSEIRTQVSQFTKSDAFGFTALPPGLYDVAAFAIRPGEWRTISLGEMRLEGDTRRELRIPAE